METVAVVQKLQQRAGDGHSQGAWVSVMSSACSHSHRRRRHLSLYATWDVLAHSVVAVAAAMLPVSLCQRVCHLGVKTQLRWLSLSSRVSLGLNMSLSLSLRSRLRDVVNWGPGTCGMQLHWLSDFDQLAVPCRLVVSPARDTDSKSYVQVLSWGYRRLTSPTCLKGKG